jgi:hypothetical protein
MIKRPKLDGFTGFINAQLLEDVSANRTGRSVADGKNPAHSLSNTSQSIRAVNFTNS